MSWEAIAVSTKHSNRTPIGGAYLRSVAHDSTRPRRFILDLGSEVVEFLGLQPDGHVILLAGRDEDEGKLGVRPAPEGLRYKIGARGSLTIRLPDVSIDALGIAPDAAPLLIEDVTTSRLMLPEGVVRLIVIDVRASTKALREEQAPQ